MIFLRLIVAVKLKSDGAGLQHLRLVGEVKHVLAVGCHTNAIVVDKDFDLIPFALLFQLTTRTARGDSIAAVRVPDAPVVAEHQQWALEAELIVTRVGQLFTEGRDS